MSDFADCRQALLDGLVSDQSEITGWNALRSDVSVSAVVRTSDAVVTITLPALPAYNITMDEIIVSTVPAQAVTSNDSYIASPSVLVMAAMPPPPDGTLVGRARLTLIAQLRSKPGQGPPPGHGKP